MSKKTELHTRILWSFVLLIKICVKIFPVQTIFAEKGQLTDRINCRHCSSVLMCKITITWNCLQIVLHYIYSYIVCGLLFWNVLCSALWKVDKIQIESACLNVYGKFSSHFSILLPFVPFLVCWFKQRFQIFKQQEIKANFRPLMAKHIYINIYVVTRYVQQIYKIVIWPNKFFHHMLNSVFFRLKDFDLIVLRQFLHSPCFGRLLKS